MTRRSHLETMIRKRVRALARHMPGALAGDVEAVHQARVASRRLREALPVFSRTPGFGSIETSVVKIRRITRALGPVRELDVALGHVQEIEQANPGRQATVLMTMHLSRDRALARDAMIERCQSVNVAKLERRLLRFATALAQSRDQCWRMKLADRLVRRAVRLKEAIDAAGAVYLAERVHTVRVALKKLRYAIELAGESRAAGTTRVLKTLKRLQEALGRLHDLEILILRAQGALGDPDSETACRDVSLVVRALEEECRQLHARYIGNRTRLLRVCDDALHRVAPRLRQTPRHASRAPAGQPLPKES